MFFSSSDDLLEINNRRELILLGLATVFVWLNAGSLSLARNGRFHLQHFWAPIVWLLLIAAAHLLLQRGKPHRDPFLLPLFALLTGWGIVLMDRLAPNFLVRQVIWVGLGTAVLLALTILPHNLNWLRQYRYTWLIGGLALLAATLLFGTNPTGFGAELWLPLPGSIFFQPSELLKLLLVVFLASYFDEREALLHLGRARTLFATLPYLGPLLLMWGFCMVLLVWQQDLGAATLFFILFLALLYLATGDRRYVAGGVLLLLLAGVIAYYLFGVVALRVDAWLNPWPEADNRAFQIVQSLYALAAGGIFGQGVGQGFPTYIPVVHSDFAFAAIAEEWGLVGSLSVTAVFALLAARGLRIALLGKRPFQKYLAAGITILFSAQAFLIMGGVTKLLPLTGVTLPFISYGGSSMLISSMMAGLLLFLSAKGMGEDELTPRLQNLNKSILLAFALIALALCYWTVVRADTILARDDNPRLVEAELRIRRGTIVDRNGRVLAQTGGSGSALRRVYPASGSGPAVGYYSFRHGTAGVEESYDAALRGDTESEAVRAWQQLLHQPPQGQNLRLTLDAEWQQQADTLLGELRGALILLELSDDGTAAIRALASHPGYDPNLLEAQFEALIDDARAPLLNRVTQSQYQPGRVLHPFILAAALEQNVFVLGENVDNANRPVPVNGLVIRCAAPPPTPATWPDVLAQQCPGPLQDLANEMGVSGLEQAFARFGLTTAPALPLAVTGPNSEPISDPAAAAIGQENLTVTPLQVALALGALGGDGRLPTPRLVTEIQEPGAEWVPVVAAAGSSPADETAVSAQTARRLRSALPRHDGILEYSVLALSGPETNTNAWYLGIYPAANPRYALVILLEERSDVTEATAIGRALLATINEP